MDIEAPTGIFKRDTNIRVFNDKEDVVKTWYCGTRLEQQSWSTGASQLIKHDRLRQGT